MIIIGYVRIQIEKSYLEMLMTKNRIRYYEFGRYIFIRKKFSHYFRCMSLTETF